MSWEHAGQTWGSRAWDWAMYQEPLNADSYGTVLELARVGHGVQLLDVACGSGLAMQHAAARGATCTGVDASEELLAVARERVPLAQLHRCDMAQIPLPDETFDVVTSFNGLQFGATGAVAECARLLKPGGTLALVFWQDPGDYGPYFAAIATCSAPPTPGAPSPMALSQPGAAEDLLESAGLTVQQRGTCRCRGLYRGTDDAYRGLAASGPAWGAIAYSGEEAFHAALFPVIQSHRDPASGRVLMEGTFGFVLARK